jgi:dolichyl-phosphate beta-glucosyltransferase
MNATSPDITIILPAYNEAATIVSTVRETIAYLRSRGLVYEIIVAADGDDGTRELVRELAQTDPQIHAIGSAQRGGKGKGIREAVVIATGAIIGFVDADNKVPIEEFDKISTHLRNGYPIVIGSRALAESTIERKQPWYRQVGSRGFYYFMQAVVNIPGIPDTQCGFKFFVRDAAREIFSLQKIDGYMFDVEILALAQRLGYRIAQVPIRWRDDGDSRLNLFAGNLRNAYDVFRIRASVRLMGRRQVHMRSRAAAANEAVQTLQGD